MERCEIVAQNIGPRIMPLGEGIWYCKTHECRMGGMTKPPVICFKQRPPSSKERQWLEKEQRRLRYRQLIGTMTREDRQFMAEIQTLLV